MKLLRLLLIAQVVHFSQQISFGDDSITYHAQGYGGAVAAEDSRAVEAGIAMLKNDGKGYSVTMNNGDLVNRHRPSVDVLFRSVANLAGSNSIGVILTGMGDDGARGMVEMHKAGSHNLAQDEESCVVYGMPRKAVELWLINN